MKPPYRADQVGSLLRPAALIEAREKARRGEISLAELRRQEDSSIREAVACTPEAATRFTSLDNLCVSPQCGFSSTHHGNKLSHDDHWRKLELTVEVAQDVWGTVV